MRDCLCDSLTEYSLPLPAPAEGFLFQRHIKTKSENGTILSITNYHRIEHALLKWRLMEEELTIISVKDWSFDHI